MSWRVVAAVVVRNNNGDLRAKSRNQQIAKLAKLADLKVEVMAEWPHFISYLVNS